MPIIGANPEQPQTSTDIQCASICLLLIFVTSNFCQKIFQCPQLQMTEILPQLLDH
jgi:hypothetical protein